MRSSFVAVLILVCTAIIGCGSKPAKPGAPNPSNDPEAAQPKATEKRGEVKKAFGDD
jgi:hypothetical protein